MKFNMKALTVFFLFIVMVSSQESSGHVYDCSTDVAKGGSGVNRTCADLRSDSKVHIQSCDKSNLYCPVSLTNVANVTGLEETSKPWKKDLAPGDVCESSDQGFRNNACTNGVCEGKPGKSSCIYDKEGAVGSQCMNRLCTPVIPSGETCQEAKGEEGAFGGLCHEGICTKYGSLTNQDQIISKDYELLCSTFYATNSEADNKKIMGGYAPQLKSDSFKRSEPADLSCEYTSYYPDTGKSYTQTEYAKGGYNKDNAHYCPKFRGQKDFVDKTKDYRIMWSKQFNCHEESSGVNCKDVINSDYQKMMIEWEIDMFETATEDSYSLVANNNDGLKKIVNREYWNLVEGDFANSVYFTSAATLLILTLLFTI